MNRTAVFCGAAYLIVGIWIAAGFAFWDARHCPKPNNAAEGAFVGMTWGVIVPVTFIVSAFNGDTKPICTL